PTATYTPTPTATNTLVPTNTPNYPASLTPSSTLSPTSTPTATPQTFWPDYAWNFNSGVEGWGNPSSHITNLGWQSGGYIGGTITGNDPYFYSADNLNIDITNNKFIKVRLKNTTPSTSAQIFFITTMNANFDEAKSKVFPITANSDYTEYTIDMSSVSGWTGTLRQLRFDPGSTNGTVSVDYIKLGSNKTASQSLMAHWNFESVTGTTVSDVASSDAHIDNATLINGPVIQTMGAQGSAVLFDGLNV